MNRRPSLRSLAVAAVAESTTSAAAMPSHPHFKLWHPHGQRGYSNRPSAPRTDHRPEFVSGDAHLAAAHEANCIFRPSYNVVPPSPQYIAGQQYSGPRPQSSRQEPPGNRPYRGSRPLGPAVGNRQRFGTQQRQQQLEPRPYKPPDYRDWEYAKSGPPPPCERFTILSYNILADYLAADHWEKLYFHIPPHIMDWTSRKRSICFELGLWSADILCLQEVDRFPDLETDLRPRGYTGIWKMRTGDAVDGCAIFWRVSRFKLLHEESIEYNKLGMRDNIAQICVLESLNGQRDSERASTPFSRHVLTENGEKYIGEDPSPPIPGTELLFAIFMCYSTLREETSSWDRILLDKAYSVSKLWDDAPVVICGDFNCTPKSPLYNFISEQKLDLSEQPRDKVSGQFSAEIRPSRPLYPYFRRESAFVTTQVSAVYEVDAQKLANPDVSTNGSYAVRNTIHEITVLESSYEDNHVNPSSHGSVSQESGTADSVSDERFESHSLVVETKDEIQENCNSFSSELQSTNRSPVSADYNSSSHEQTLHDQNDKIHSGIPYTQHELTIDERKYSFGSSAWTPMEIEMATGSADCKVMEHSLKLSSAYAKVESSSGLRDSNGEPYVTSYHRRFSGTVDYIWVSEGLQPAKVLAPIPKHVMHHTRGFPTKKWGSDHIALVSELAFCQ